MAIWIVMKRIGIIGGMGPQATIDLYQQIVNRVVARCDQAHIPVVIDCYPQIEDRTAFILGKGDNPQSKLIESAQRLENAGAQALIMACNTAHYFSQAICEAVNIPLLSIAQVVLATVKDIVPRGGKVCVLATEGTNRARIYSQPLADAGYQVVALTEVQQQMVMRVIYDGAKVGAHLLAVYAPYLDLLISEIEADVFLLACTELPLFLPYLTTQKVMINPTQLLADAAIAFAQSA